MNDTFLPGKWMDNIDVNDFINLNKNPLTNLDIWMNKKIPFDEYVSFLKTFENKDIVGKFPYEKLLSIDYIHNRILGFPLETKDFPFPFGQEKSFSDLFKETSSLSLKNAMRIGLLENDFGEKVPPIFSPDVRQLPLYGLRKITNYKKKWLKKSEEEFQSPNWIEKRIQLHRQVESLHSLERDLKFLSVDPSASTKETMDQLLIAILFSIKENPNNTFHIPSLIDFLDIFIDRDIQLKRIDEKESLYLLTEFYTKLIFIHIYFKKKDINYLVTETLHLQNPTRTLLNFLEFYSHLEGFKFSVIVVNQKNVHIKVKKYLNEFLNNKDPVRFVNKRLLEDHTLFSMSHLGFPYQPDKDIILFNKTCELSKLFYLTLNGGKDVRTNHNLLPPYLKYTEDDIDFNSFMNDFKDFISFVFTIYSEANNLNMYLSEKYFSHPLRISFNSNFQLYHYYFSFLNVDKLANKLLALKNKKYVIERNENNHINKFRQTDTFDKIELSEMITDIAFMLNEEMNKVPYYQLGEPHIFLHLKEPLSTINEYTYDLFPPEMMKLRFIVNQNKVLTTYDDLLKVNNLNILDVKAGLDN